MIAKCKTGLAWMLVLAVMVGSTWFSARRTLSSMAGKVEDAYQNGANGDGLCIAGDLRARLESSYNLVVVARRYLEEDAVQPVLDARNRLEAASGARAQAQANLRLTEAITQLYEDLEDASLTVRDDVYRRGLYADLEARNQTIGFDGYNGLVQDFNQTLDAFPASWLAQWTGVEKAEYFQP